MGSPKKRFNPIWGAAIAVLACTKNRNAILGWSVGTFLFVLGAIVYAYFGASLATSATASIGFGIALSFGRKWYRIIMCRVEQHTEHLKAVTVLSGMMDGPPVYWSPHAVAPETLCLILHLLHCLRARRILELGSGISTLFIAKLLKDSGSGTIHSFDHDKRWADVTAAGLQERGLGHVAHVTVAPLEKIDVRGEIFTWYCLPNFEPGETVDFIIVDGPPAWQGDDLARLPALYQLRGAMNANTVVVLDDANRGWETEVARRWRRDFPDLRFQKIDVGRGLLVVSESTMVFDLLP